MSRSRERSLPEVPGNSVVVGTYTTYNLLSGAVTGTYARYGPKVNVIPFREVTLDELHPGPPFRSGGPFSNWKYSTDEHEVKGLGTYRGFYGTRLVDSYTGGHCYNGNLISKIDYLVDDPMLDDLEEYGATGWSRFRPGKPSADLTVFLAELRDLPRMLKTTAKGFYNLWRSMGGSRTGFGPKHVADHWLNTQFGWFPFVNDLRKFYNTTQVLDRRIAQLRRDNGQWIKRGGTVLEEEDVSVSSYAGTMHSPVPSYYALGRSHNTGYTQWTIKTFRKVWFEARFRYWMPWLPQASWEGAAAYMFGLRVSPAVLWEITPWSWLVDWCTNAGDVIENVTSMVYDNLAAKYAYVMGNVRHQVEALSIANYVDGGPISNTWVAYAERKRRLPASPFGFGLVSTDFSARQWSILAALGLSRFNL